MEFALIFYLESDQMTFTKEIKNKGEKFINIADFLKTQNATN